jgi:hypothetical protein
VPTTCVEGDDLVVKTASLRPANGFVDVVHVDSGSKSTKPIALRGGDAPRLSEFSQLLPGVHRVIVRTADRMVPPVSDYVFVTER